MPSSPNYKRDYKQERKTAIARGETANGSKSSDARRHRARRALEKKLGHDIPSHMDVDHKKPLKSGGSNSISNLRVRSRKENRSDGGKSGDRKGKARGGRIGK